MKGYSFFGRITLTGLILIGALITDHMGSAGPAQVAGNTSLPIAAAAVQPAITLNPASGGANTQVTVTGTGFPPNAHLSAYLGPPDADAIPNAYAEAVADAKGGVRMVLTVPGQWPDGRLISEEKLVILVATDDFSVTATAEFTYVVKEGEASSATARTAIQPTISLDPISGGPKSNITVVGAGFPAAEVVSFYLTVPLHDTLDNQLISTQSGDHSMNLSAAMVNPDGTFKSNLTLPTTWPNGERIVQSTLMIIAATSDFSVRASANFTLINSSMGWSYWNGEGGFAMMLPDGWTVSRSKQALFGSMYLLGPAPLVEGELGNSLIIIVDAAEVPLERAIQQLCGGGCVVPPEVQDTAIHGRPAKRAVIGSEGWPAVEWHFVKHNRTLICFSIHDPVTMEPLDDVIQTVTFYSDMDSLARRISSDGSVSSDDRLWKDSVLTSALALLRRPLL